MTDDLHTIIQLQEKAIKDLEFQLQELEKVRSKLQFKYEIAEAKIEEQKWQISHHSQEQHRKNVTLDALYYVWCTGGCKNGVLRYVPGTLTQEVVDAAVRNAKRLEEYWKNYKYREERRNAKKE